MLSNYNQFIIAGVIRPVNGVWNWIEGHYNIPVSATIKQDSDYIVLKINKNNKKY